MRDDCSGHIESTDPRRAGRCVKCGALMLTPKVTPLRPRNVDLERALTEIAAAAASIPGAAALVTAHAEARIAPGGIRDIPFTVEALEEASDGRNYCCWEIEKVYDAACRGDAHAVGVYERHMRALSLFVQAFSVLAQE